MNTETCHKKIGLAGRLFTISGSSLDDYFRGIPEGEYPDPVLSGLRPLIGDRAVCIDVGANIGLYSLAMSVLAPNGHIYAFEPSKNAFEYLQANLAQNAVTNVSVSPLALGSSDHAVRFHDIPFFTAGSFTVDESCFLTSEILGSTYFEADCTTLDEFVEKEGIGQVDLVKIDVEGGEMAVIEGALGTIRRFQPLVLMEFSSFALTLTQSTLPQTALERIRQTFPYVFVIDREDGRLSRLQTGAELYDFLYDNGIHGPVDNLLCSYQDLGVTRGYVRRAVLEDRARQAEEAARLARESPGETTDPAAERPRTAPGGGTVYKALRKISSRVRAKLAPTAKRGR